MSKFYERIRDEAGVDPEDEMIFKAGFWCMKAIYLTIIAFSAILLLFFI